MPKFKIEMELSSLTDRILLTDFDSSVNSVGGLTFDENLTEEENGIYNLSFSIAQKTYGYSEIQIEKLIAIGRPLWLHLTNPNRSIRMVITSFSPVIGSENIIYEIQAQDYASHTFSKNNAGLTLDTIEDEDFWQWMREYGEPFWLFLGPNYRRFDETKSNHKNFNLVFSAAQCPDTVEVREQFLDTPPSSPSSGDIFKVDVYVNGSVLPQNFCETYYFTFTPVTTVRNLANHILERGWLRKRNDQTFEGWSIAGAKLNNLTNISVSDSNTYGALVELANTLNMNVAFNYDYPSGENPTVIFIDRESEALDKNYTLRRGFNVQDYGLSYSGENLYSIFYVQGGEDEFGLFTTINEVTPYRDNFLFNFDYFDDKGLIDKESTADDINNDLAKINNELKDLIDEELDILEKISNRRTKIQIFAEEILAGENTNNEKYINFNNIFKTINTENNIDVKARTPQFTELWTRANPLFRADVFFPIKVQYDDITPETVFDEEGEVEEISGIDIALFLENAPGRITYTKNGLTIYIQASSGFDIEKFKVVSSAIQYKKLVTFDNSFFEFPYFNLLFSYNGNTTIEEELEEYERRVDSILEEWDKRFDQQLCLQTIQYTKDGVTKPLTEWELNEINLTDLSSETTTSAWDDENGFCAINFALPSLVANAKTLLEAYEQEVEAFETGVGKYNPQTKELDPNEVGIWTFILAKFRFFLNLYNEQGFFPQLVPVIQRKLQKELEKRNFWYTLKKNKQHVFVEGYFDNDIETTPETLKAQAEAIYKDFQKPNEDFNITYIDISDIVGVNVQDIQVGDFVRIKDEDQEIAIDSESKLKVASISRVLRDKGNISLTIYRYNLINRIIERVISTSGQ